MMRFWRWLWWGNADADVYVSESWLREHIYRDGR